MKAESPAASPANLLNLRALPASGVIRPDQGESAKLAQTARPVSEAAALGKARTDTTDADAPQAAASNDVDQKTKLQFSVDESSGRMVVSIVDRATSEVVRQIPAEDMLAVARQIEERLRDTGSTDGLFVADEA